MVDYFAVYGNLRRTPLRSCLSLFGDFKKKGVFGDSIVYARVSEGSSEENLLKSFDKNFVLKKIMHSGNGFSNKKFSEAFGKDSVLEETLRKAFRLFVLKEKDFYCIRAEVLDEELFSHLRKDFDDRFIRSDVASLYYRFENEK